MSLSLTLQHRRVIYLLKETAANRKLIHRFIDVYEHPDGRIELRAEGVSLAYDRYDKLQQIDAAAVVENKRLDHALRVAQELQAIRDDRRATPSRTNQGHPPRVRKAVPGTTRARHFKPQEFEKALRKATFNTPATVTSSKLTRHA